MIKRKIIETVKEYDEHGRLTRETITETNEDDDTAYFPYQPVYPTTPYNPVTYGTETTCNCKNNKEEC